MSKYIDTDLLRKEIEFAKSVYSYPNRVVHGVADAFRQDGRVAMCDDILKKIDSLQQEQSKIEEDLVEKRKQECGCRRLSANGSYQCEKYEGVFGSCDGQCSWIVDYPKLKELEEREQPEVDLEREIDKVIADYSFVKAIDSDGFKVTIDNAKIARHFYELGLNTRKKE